MTKITYIDALNTAIEVLEQTACTMSREDNELDLAAKKLESLRDQLTKRNTAKSDKPTKTQVENASIKAELLTHITAEGVRCGDLAAAVGISGQKASALLSQMVREGTCRKVEGAKRVTLFALPSEG